jgi:hypothetical protein
MLILRNVLRTAALNFVAEFVMFVGKVCITLICAALGCKWCDFIGRRSAIHVTTHTDYYMNTYMSDQLSGLVLPTLLIAILAFQVSSAFLETMAITAECMLHCFIADEEMFSGAYVVQR